MDDGNGEFRAGLKPTKSTRWTSSTHTSDETREYSRRNRAKTRSDSSSVVSSRCPNLCLLIRMACIPSLEGGDTGVVFVLALDNRFALGTVNLGGTASAFAGGR